LSGTALADDNNDVILTILNGVLQQNNRVLPVLKKSSQSSRFVGGASKQVSNFIRQNNEKYTIYCWTV